MKLDDEDKALLLLSSLLKSFQYFKDVIFYGKEDTITLEEVQSTIRTNELTKIKELKIDDNDECLTISRRVNEK